MPNNEFPNLFPNAEKELQNLIRELAMKKKMKGGKGGKGKGC